jgi:hypothetical protein
MDPMKTTELDRLVAEWRGAVKVDTDWNEDGGRRGDYVRLSPIGARELLRESADRLFAYLNTDSARRLTQFKYSKNGDNP